MAAPSFSSFPPSFSSFPDLEPGPSESRPPSEPKERRSKDRESTKKQDKDRKHKRGTDNEGHRRHKSKKPKTREREYSEEQRELKSKRYGDYESSYSPLDGKPVFYSDGRGDALNITYGGLHSGDVPKYNAVARGRKVLGLPALTVLHKGHHSIAIGIGGKRKLPGLTDSSSRHLLRAPPTKRLLAASEDKYKHEEMEGFLRISIHRARTGEPSYRSITVSKHTRESEESSSSSESEGAESSGDESDTTPETSLQATLKSLEERLVAHPDSISTWLSLLSHTLSTVPTTSKNAMKARAEIATSVLSRALTAHPSNARSKSLRLRYLQAGEEIWNEGQIRAEWEVALRDGGKEIYIEWLDWRIRRAEKDLDGIVQSARRVYTALGDDEVAKLRAFWRVAIAFRDAGYTERAMALFQAQAELAYQAPSNLRTASTETQLGALEEFWESELPRIGEPSSSGWAAWVNSGRPEVTSPPNPRKTQHDISHMDPYIRWAAQEAQDDKNLILPSRSFDEDEDTDPYATILFSDIQPLLFPLASSNARHAFRLIWLSFLGLNVPGFVGSLSEVPVESTDDRWATRHLASPAYLSAIFPPISSSRRITADAHAGVLVGREPEYASVFGPVKSCTLGVLRPLDIIGKKDWTIWSEEDVEGVDEDIVKEVFRLCRFLQDETEWDNMSLAFETALNAKNAVKKSKAFLAKASDSLPRWAAHARIERIRGRFDEARKIYQTVLSSSPHPFAYSWIWWDWAELEWLSGNADAAMQVVLRSTGTRGSGGIATLRAKRHLDDVIGQHESSRWKEREGWIKLRALLELLSSSIHTAVSYLDSMQQSMDSGSVAHESLTTAVLLFVYYDGIVLRNPIPPVLLRERVEHAMDLYPNNTIILGLFLEAQKGQGVWGRMRALLGEQNNPGMTKEKDVARRIAEVWVASWEKGRWEAEQERTRNGLSNAVQNDRTRGSPTLWRIYLEFEIRCGQLQRAKKLLFRAAGECPLVKELYLLAFGPLRSVFSSRELNDWAETMAERGIRMRTGLDEALEGWREGGSGSDGENAEGMPEDEIEYNAAELRRLRPY